MPTNHLPNEIDRKTESLLLSKEETFLRIESIVSILKVNTTPKLSEKTISTQMLKYFAKLQMDQEPGIRTNTTICLGNYFHYLIFFEFFTSYPLNECFKFVCSPAGFRLKICFSF